MTKDSNFTVTTIPTPRAGRIMLLISFDCIDLDRLTPKQRSLQRSRICLAIEQWLNSYPACLSAESLQQLRNLVI